LTPRETGHGGDAAGSTALETRADSASQADGLKVLLSIAVDRAEDLLDEIALREEEALTTPIEVIQDSRPVPLSLPESESGANRRRRRRAAWRASCGAAVRDS